MPVKRTSKGGKPAFKWGDSGKAYVYTPGDKASRAAAKAKALKQAAAIKARRR